MSAPATWTAATARWIAALRERESARPNHLFNDPYATLFAGPEGRRMLARSEEAAGGENKHVPVRVRYFDDLVLNTAVEQLALLGAGFDTRAIRLDLPPEQCVFELDVAQTLQEKRRLLLQANAQPRCRVVDVPTRFDAAWPDELVSAGFQPAATTLWLAEGLLFYLAEHEVDALLDQTRKLSGAGSFFAADLSATGILRLPQMQSYLAWLAAEGRPPPFCCDHPAELFGRFGWRVSSCVQYGQAAANYGRLPLAPETTGFHPASSFLVVARRD